MINTPDKYQIPFKKRLSYFVGSFHLSYIVWRRFCRLKIINILRSERPGVTKWFYCNSNALSPSNRLWGFVFFLLLLHPHSIFAQIINSPFRNWCNEYYKMKIMCKVIWTRKENINIHIKWIVLIAAHSHYSYNCLDTIQTINSHSFTRH